MKLVLDTNVWIDWLVFDDPAVALLKSALRDGQLQIVVNKSCLGELNAVLAYPEFELAEAQKIQYLAEVGRCTIMCDDRQATHAAALPRCTDPDDQKFLALAQDAAADWLLTRDKALLRIRQKKLEEAGFQIGTPAQWVASLPDCFRVAMPDTSSCSAPRDGRI
jgi:putative PIN family toxin of toxin-antitoxin system